MFVALSRESRIIVEKGINRLMLIRRVATIEEIRIAIEKKLTPYR